MFGLVPVLHTLAQVQEIALTGWPKFVTADFKPATNGSPGRRLARHHAIAQIYKYILGNLIFVTAFVMLLNGTAFIRSTNLRNTAVCGAI